MVMKSVSLDLDANTLDRLSERERETGESRSALAQRYIEEGLRMERHPGIVFRDGPTGRRAALITGPDVWELVSEIRGVEPTNDEEIEAIATWMSIPPAYVRAAITYYAEFRDEIDERVELNRTVGDRHRAAWRAERGLPPELSFSGAATAMTDVGAIRRGRFPGSCPGKSQP